MAPLTVLASFRAVIDPRRSVAVPPVPSVILGTVTDGHGGDGHA
ncbi:hypothetical protein RAJCM14343_4360 [Rhodococcus aetherivorans]|uniref:Uncharacterized protein n=1 Tax=Rhodococcus aetherivorans TaxID=191292 RepID=A0ABQ0YR73_9NOCA|nr:hypothetical protein RAJCM14343_4360 [Rhodococcus aetherivorans]